VAAELKFHAQKFKVTTGKQLQAGLQAAAAELTKIAREMAGIRNQGVQVPVKRQTKGGNKTTRTIYPHSSKPGESPRRRTGAGQKGIVWNWIGGSRTARVGYTRLVRYMTYHELGIHYSRVGFQRRPTIIPALTNNWARLNAVALAAGSATR
jgi:hypothetical protein